MKKSKRDIKRLDRMRRLQRVFDGFTGESYYGLNMKSVLFNMPDSDFAQLEASVNGLVGRCIMKRRAARGDADVSNN